MRWLLPLFLILSGCAPIDRNVIVCPSEGNYFAANRCYDARDFSRAAELYRTYLEDKPRSKYAVPAQLNLGMSLYYMEDWASALEALQGLTIEDPNIRSFVDGVMAECARNAGVALPAATASAEKPLGEPVVIEVLDAYLDLTRAVVIRGRVNKKATLSVNKIRTGVDDNLEFTVTASWRRGRPIEILAKGADNSEGTLNFYPDSEPPDEPENLQLRHVSSNSAEIEWDDNRESDLKGYKLYYGLRGGTRIEVNEIITRTSYEAVGLERLVSGANRTITFTVKAVDKMENESVESDPLEVTLP